MTNLLQRYSKSTPASLALWPVVQTAASHLGARHNLPQCPERQDSVVFGEHFLATVGPGLANRLNSVQAL
jgi:hypothetical protein